MKATVLADPHGLVQVITNPLTNALKFTPGKRRLTIGAGRPGCGARSWHA